MHVYIHRYMKNNDSEQLYVILIWYDYGKLQIFVHSELIKIQLFDMNIIVGYFRQYHVCWCLRCVHYRAKQGADYVDYGCLSFKVF